MEKLSDSGIDTKYLSVHLVNAGDNLAPPLINNGEPAEAKFWKNSRGSGKAINVLTEFLLCFAPSGSRWPGNGDGSSFIQTECFRPRNKKKAIATALAMVFTWLVTRFKLFVVLLVNGLSQHKRSAKDTLIPGSAIWGNKWRWMCSLEVFKGFQHQLCLSLYLWQLKKYFNYDNFLHYEQLSANH